MHSHDASFELLEGERPAIDPALDIAQLRRSTGDHANARYWYRRAGRAFPRGQDPCAEIDALVSAWKKETE